MAQEELRNNLVSEKVVTLMTIYLMFLLLISLYIFLTLWPATNIQLLRDSTMIGGNSSTDYQVLYWKITVKEDIAYFYEVLIAGLLGSLIHTIHSFSNDIGMRRVKKRWLTIYITKPFTGAALGLLVVFIIRGGFFSTQISGTGTSPFGYIAIASIAGMFSTLVLEKMKTTMESFSAGDNILQEKDKEKILIEREELPSLVDQCVDWARVNGLKSVTKADIETYLLESNLDIKKETQRSLYAMTNTKLKTKR